MSKSPLHLQYPDPQISIHNHRCNGIYDEIYDENNNCEICELNTPHYNCNQCSKSICGEDDCCITFPHYLNTTYFVCKTCYNEISLKLIAQIDMRKLILLKEKIRTGTTCNSVCSSRTTSSGSYSPNMNSIGRLCINWDYSLSNSDSSTSSNSSNSSDSFTNSNSSDSFTNSNSSELCT
jgi:hypothetical protein